MENLGVVLDLKLPTALGWGKSNCLAILLNLPTAMQIRAFDLNGYSFCFFCFLTYKGLSKTLKPLINNYTDIYTSRNWCQPLKCGLFGAIKIKINPNQPIST